MIKRVISTIVCIVVTAVPLCARNEDIVYAYEGSRHIIHISVKNEYMPQSDSIVWVYKREGGKLYKRQYNKTKNIWIGEWKPV